MGSGERSQQGSSKLGVPKGYLAIKVGHESEEKQRFVVPIMYFNHPLFIKLLKEAEEEYGFHQKGTITIPCHLHQFRYVQALIDQEISFHHQNLHVPCFRVSSESSKI